MKPKIQGSMVRSI